MSKEFLGVVAMVLTIAAFFPYIRSVHTGKTRPHVFSWIIWGMTPLIVFVAQLVDRGGAGAWSTGLSGAVGLYVALIAWLRRGDTTIARTDWLFFVAALMSLPLWGLTSDPLWAVIVLTLVDILGFGPTIRKAYHRPHEEQLTFFVLMVARNVIAVAALENLSATTLMFPVATTIVCLFFIPVVMLRRNQPTVDQSSGGR